MKKIDWLIIFIILVISVVTLKDLFKPGMYTSHDGIHQVVRFFYFDQAIKDGQIPPRWSQGLMNGFGYPIFIFSYHLPWFISEIIHTFGSSIIDSVKMTFLVGFMLSGITMYLFQKDLYGRLAAVAGTAVYLFAPYRFSNIFVRAAIGDATCFIFAPLLFWSAVRLRKSWSWVWIGVGGIGISGLILSHAMVAALFFSALGIYFLFSLITVKNRFTYLKSFICMVMLGLGISAYYFIPSFLERNNTLFQSLMSPLFLGSFFASLPELLYSKWGYGTFHAKEGGMSIQLGITQWLSVIAASIFVFILPIISKTKSKTEKQLIRFGRILIVIFAVTILMMLPISLPFWKIVNQTVFIDFPWRYLAVATFITSLCAGLFVSIAGRGKVIITVMLILSAVYLNRNHLRINESLTWDVPFMLKLEKTTNSFGEYTPKWVKPDLIVENKPKVEFTSKNVSLRIGKNSSNYLGFDINSAQEGIVRVNTIYYPGWVAYIDGKSEPISYESTGLIEFPVRAGKSGIILKFEDTPIRKLGNIISIFSVLVLFWGIIKYRKE